jgi:hypothetical protein
MKEIPLLQMHSTRVGRGTTCLVRLLIYYHAVSVHRQQHRNPMSQTLCPAIVVQVTANPELQGVVARGANQLPTAVLQKAMRPLYGGPLNFVAFSRAVESLDGWYRDRGILGQVRDRRGVGKWAYIRYMLGLPGSSPEVSDCPCCAASACSVHMCKLRVC